MKDSLEAKDSYPVAARFINGYKQVSALQRHPRYLGAIIFGSVAEGTSNENSDLDVKVVVSEENACQNINHPMIDGYKLDVTFRSINELRFQTKEELQKSWGREPNMMRSLIVFDKTGDLHELQQEVKDYPPVTYTDEEHQMVQFMLYHANNKVERYLIEDQPAALYSMHANISEVLKIHYKLQGHWWVSSKKVLSNLDTWDQPLAELVRSFVTAGNINKKFGFWSQIIDHIVRPLGGRQPIQENNCDCKTCITDLSNLLAPL